MVVCGVEGKGRRFGHFSLPQVPGCVHYRAGQCDGGSEAFFFFLISHQSFPSLKVGDDFLEHTSVASHALAAFEKKKILPRFRTI